MAATAQPGGGGNVLPAFEAWMAGAGIKYSDAIRLVGAAEGCSGLALGVQAARDVAEAERLCTIPKAACLSIRTTELADVIEAEELGGGLGLVLAVLHEMSLGSDSKWHGYFRALPPREYLPLFWSEAELRQLKGTKLEGKVEADREAAAEDFREHVLPLLAKYPGRLRPGFITLANFHVAASFVASRAFGVDEWHGDAMVPLADIFNHKASVVDLGEGYAVHGAQDSDSDGDSEEEGEEEDGEESGSGSKDEGAAAGDQGRHAGHANGAAASAAEAAEEHGHRSKRHKHEGGCCGTAPGEKHSHGHHHKQQQQQPEGEEEEGAGAADGEALPAVMSGGVASIYGLQSANGLHLRLEMGIVDRDEHTLEIVAASAVPAGAEVHNTYGELGNAELVKKYGFALRQCPFTAVTLDKRRLLAAAAKALGSRAWRARSKVLREQTEVLEDDEEPFEALPNGHISTPLFVALRVLGASDAELASWQGIQDALRLPGAAAAEAAASPAAEGKQRDSKAASGSSGSEAEHGSAADDSEGEEAGSGSDGDSEEDEEEGEGEALGLSAVQVWPVLGPDGSPLEPAAGQEASAAASAEQQAEQQVGHALLLPASMWRLLREEVRQRLAAYSSPLDADLRQLAALDTAQQAQQAGQQAGQEDGEAAADGGRALSERQSSERAALLLRTTEKEVLRDLLLALDLRLAATASGEADGQAAEPQDEEAAAPRAGRRQAASGKGRADGGKGKRKQR